MFGFTEVAIRGYHSAECELYVQLQADKTTFIHQFTNLSDEIALIFSSNYNSNNTKFLLVQQYNFSLRLDFCWERCAQVIAQNKKSKNLLSFNMHDQ